MIQPFTRTTLDVLADFAEAYCLSESGHTLSRSTLDSILEARSFPDHDVAAGQVWTQLARRSEVLADRYPFDWEKNFIRARVPIESSLPYRFMLLLSCDGYTTGRSLGSGRVQKASKAFEKLTTHAIGNYLGAAATNIGFPRETSLPRSLADCIDAVCTKSCEPRGDTRPRPKMKDDGADIIGWIPHGDGRGGQVLVLAACTIEPDLIAKKGELSIDTWTSYIHSLIPMIRAYSIPFVQLEGGILGSENWVELTRALEGMLLDRLRLSINSTKAPLPTPLSSELQAFCTEILGALPA